MRSLKLLCGAAGLVVFLAPGAHADEWNKKTYLTFSGPVQIPGATLQAGTYTFELALPNSSRHLIRVTEKDSGKPVGLFMTIPNERLEAPSDNLVMFSERPAGAPQAIQVWFYPGDRIGEEFVYPRNQAIAIAKANRTPVLATSSADNAASSEADRVAAMKDAQVGRVDETGRMTSSDSRAASDDNRTASTTAAPANTVDGSRTERRDANASATADRSRTDREIGTAGSRNAGPARTARRQLPRTASNLPLFGLLSGLALAGAFGVRRLRRGYVSAR